MFGCVCRWFLLHIAIGFLQLWITLAFLAPSIGLPRQTYLESVFLGGAFLFSANSLAWSIVGRKWEDLSAHLAAAETPTQRRAALGVFGRALVAAAIILAFAVNFYWVLHTEKMITRFQIVGQLLLTVSSLLLSLQHMVDKQRLFDALFPPSTPTEPRK